MSRRERGVSTRAIHADRSENPTLGVSPPIFATSTYRWTELDDGTRAAGERHPPQFYARLGNPNVRQIEAIVASLEGAEAALACGSGSAAATLSVLPFVTPGDHVVAGRTLYGETNALLTKLCAPFGVRVTFARSAAADDYAAAAEDRTRLFVVETPANPTLDVVDLRAVAGLARARGAMLVVDNTFATPVNTRPIALGADLVFHSATKYLSGHSDATAGVVAGAKTLIDRAWDHLRFVGSALSPFDAWLVTRGARTLGLRMARHNQNGLAIAKFLRDHKAISLVRYPGLDTDPGHAIARAQMSGFGAMMSIELGGGERAARTFTERLTLFTRATSLGGVESLAQFPSSLSNLTPEEKRAAGIAPWAVRLSVGCEDEADLLEDLDQALAGL